MAPTNPPADNDEVYELPVNDGTAPITPSEWRAAATATYKLEVPVRCPYCDEVIQTIGIVGLTRTQVSFTSTLPRKGRVAICPECDRILPAELSGMM
jgi:hypothetical protein